MTSREIRKQFLEFFKDKQHRIVDSAPVVPYDDPTLLFTNAGMNQFKDVFLGKGTRDYKRATDTQKCIRVSGKHNDLEEVGHDTYHHTFFEMLGNWSFGDLASPADGYYKKEAIRWAWELLTGVWKLPKERLFATVYKSDDEALELWKSETDINPAHILRFAEKDNFWEMGDTGPCGPCSEIHINLTDDYDNPEFVNAGKPECIEIWNLVFIQYNRDENGTLHELPAKHVDTGMGFERVCAVLQGKKSNYDTDVFTPVIDVVSKLSGISYDDSLSANDISEKGQTNIAMRVIADHIRTLTFAIADGATPGNEGRGYVLRRILRRAARYGRKLNLNEPFLYKLVDVLVETMGDVFKEIEEQKTNVKKIIRAEEESFNATLDNGIEEYNKVVAETVEKAFNLKTDLSVKKYTVFNFKNMLNDWELEIRTKDGTIIIDSPISLDNINKELLYRYFNDELIIPGDAVFKLYDTFGFPVDLTNVMAKEKGFSIDEKRFNELMDEQRARARKSTKDKLASAHALEEGLSGFKIESESPTVFTGYNELMTTAKIIGIKNEDVKSFVILDKTPFYVESGGQVDDHGILIIGDTHLKVSALTKINNQVVHIIENESGIKIETGMEVIAHVDEKRRWDIMRNHSVTHFLHKALRQILGTHVQQSGSYVGPDRLRFDFAHFEKMKDDEIVAVESIVNEKLLENIPLIHHLDTPFEEAKKMGALMFFGDKYGDKVNVVQFGDFTMEFCGGTHVKNSSQIGLFKIVSESSIASGIRRIEAVTGAGVEKYIKEQEARIQKSEDRITELLEEKKKLEKELAELKLQSKLGGIDSIVSSPVEVNGVKIFKGKVEASNMDELKSMGDDLRNKIKSGVGLLISSVEDKVQMVCVVTDDLIKEKKILAGNIVKQVAQIVGGSGGGKPHMATAGGKDVSKIEEALASLEKIF